MIFVTVGACYFQFDRLLRALDALPGDEELIVQHGPSDVRPARASHLVDFMPLDRVVEHVRRARVVVTHGGIGSILVSLSNGKRPVVVPRLPVHGEIVDDHQVTSARRFESEGLVTVVEDLDLLAAAVLGPGVQSAAPTAQLGGGLVAELREYLRPGAAAA
jgi:UDP-N-acetylglucosamine transferase subunit ALG13